MIVIDHHIKKALHKFFGDENNLRPADISAQTGIIHSTISRWISGTTKNMGNDNWLKMEPFLRKYLPDGYRPRDSHGKIKIFNETHNYNNVQTINQGTNCSLSEDPLFVQLTKYYKSLPNDALKLQVLVYIQNLLNSSKES
jgi:hypothetical protein